MNRFIATAAAVLLALGIANAQTTLPVVRAKAGQTTCLGLLKTRVFLKLI